MSQPFDVVGYTGDADAYCPPCAKMRYGDGISGNNGIKDREGNLVGPIFADSEWDYAVSCGSCHEYISTNLTDDGIKYTVEMIQTSLNSGLVTNFLMEVADSLLWMRLNSDTSKDNEAGKIVLAYIEMGSKSHAS